MNKTKKLTIIAFVLCLASIAFTIPVSAVAEEQIIPGAGTEDEIIIPVLI
jgi:hypothetical protein